MFHLHFDSHSVYCLYEGKFHGLLDFLFQIYSSVTFSPNPLLPQIRHIIVNMFSSILIVTVKIYDTGDVLGP